MALTERNRQRAIRRKWQRTGRCWVCGKPRGMTNRRAICERERDWWRPNGLLGGYCEYDSRL